MDAKDALFAVERDGVVYQVRGSDIQDKCKDGDKFAVWRAGTVYQWERRETNHAWEKQTFWYHVKNLTEELFLWPRDEVGIIWDKSTGERVGRMLPGGEYMIAGYNEEGHKVRFEGNSGNWDFGDESDTSLLTDGRRFFAECPNFNGDVSVMASSVWANVEEMFLNCTSFNQPIGDWYVSEIKNNWELYDLFKGASAFDQDLSTWCMWDRQLDSRDIVKLSPDEWAEGAPIASQREKHPQWLCYKEAVTRTIRVDDGSAM